MKMTVVVPNVVLGTHLLDVTTESPGHSLGVAQTYPGVPESRSSPSRGGEDRSGRLTRARIAKEAHGGGV